MSSEPYLQDDVQDEDLTDDLEEGEEKIDTAEPVEDDNLEEEDDAE